MLTKKHRWLGLAFIFFLFNATLFCYWFKLNQLKLIAPEAISFYPISYWCESIFSGVLILLSLFFGWTLFWNLIYKLDFRSLAFNTLGILPLNLVWIGVPLKGAFLISLLMAGTLIFLLRPEPRIAKKDLAQHLAAFGVILLVQIFSLQFVSPLNWDNPIAGIRRYESAWTMTTSPMFLSNYSDAKRFELLTFNRSLWGAGPRGVAFDSNIVSFATLLFDLPVIDNECFVRLILMMFFIASVLGCFGFYLYLIVALKLSSEFSLIGGCFYLLFNPFFSTLFTQYFPVFITPYFLFPYALLFLHFGSTTKALSAFIAAGSFLSLNLYFIQSHPDTIYQAYGMLGVFGFFYVWKHRSQVRFSLLIIPSILVGLLCGSALKLSGIIEPILRHEAVMYAHQRAENFAGGLRAGWNYFLMAPLRSFFLLVPLLVMGTWMIKRTKEGDDNQRFLFDAFLGLVFLFLLCIVPGSDGPLAWFLAKFSISSLSFGHYGRIGCFYGFVMLVIFCISGNAVFLWLHSKTKVKNSQTMFLLILPGVAALALILWKRGVLFDYYPLQISVLFGIYLFSRAFGIYVSSRRTYFICLLFILAYAASEQSLFSWTSAKKEQNPSNCKPYLALESLLMKEKLFLEDKNASETLITKRLKAYEVDSNRKLEYGSQNVIDFARMHSAEIDRFYLEDYPCKFPADKEQSVYGRTQFNHELLFKNVESQFQVLRLGITPFEHYAIGHGLITVNFDLSPDLKFMGVFPPINALYAIPGHLFERVGSYEAKSAGDVKAEAILNPEMRKIYQLAGVDIHVVDNSAAQQVLKEEGIELIEGGVPAGIPTPYSVIRDKKSYGLAYLASHVEYIDPKLNLLKTYRPPFAKRPEEYFRAYKENVGVLSKKLLALNRHHSAVVDDETKINQIEEGSSENSLKILSIRNSKAAFEVECKVRPCRLVYNHAAISGWRAYSNGSYLNIQPANFGFLSVDVPIGKQFVFLEYRPLGELICQMLTLLHYVVLLGWGLLLSRNRNILGNV